MDDELTLLALTCLSGPQFCDTDAAAYSMSKGFSLRIILSGKEVQSPYVNTFRSSDYLTISGV